MDWPLSREEKKRQMLQLYDREEQEQKRTDSALISGQAALARMKAELETVKSKSKALVDHQQGLSEDSQRLWQALEAVSAVFRAVVPTEGEDDQHDDEPCMERRARSANTTIRASAEAAPQQPTRPLKSRTPRNSLTGRKRRVSFGKEESTPEPKKAEPSPLRQDPSDSEPGEPEPCSGPHMVETRPIMMQNNEPEPEEDLQPARILEWGLTDICVPHGVAKVGIHFKLPPEPLLVHKVTEGSWAEEQGVCAGDMVYAVAGQHADSISAERFVRLMLGRPLNLTIERLSKTDFERGQGC